MNIKLLRKFTNASKNTNYNYTTMILDSFPLDFTQKDSLKHLNFKKNAGFWVKFFSSTSTRAEPLNISKTVAGLEEYLLNDGKFSDPAIKNYFFQSIDPVLLKEFDISREIIKKNGGKIVKTNTNPPVQKYETLVNYYTDGSVLFREMNQPIENYDIIRKKKRVKFKLKDGIEEFTSKEKKLIWKNLDIQEKELVKESMMDSMGYEELKRDRDDFSLVIGALEVTCTYVLVMNAFNLTVDKIKKGIIQQKIRNGYELENDVHLLRFEKIEAPWESNWILTDVDHYMKRNEKWGGFYEYPIGKIFEGLR